MEKNKNLLNKIKFSTNQYYLFMCRNKNFMDKDSLGKE